MAKKTIKVMTAPATTESEIDDAISRSSRDEAGVVTVPGKLSQWLNPRTKGKPVLDPVLLAAREEASGKKSKRKKRPVEETELPPAGGDGLPRPGRR